MLRTSNFDTKKYTEDWQNQRTIRSEITVLIFIIIIIELRAAAINKRLFHLYSSITTRTWLTKFFGSSRQFPALIQTKSRFPNIQGHGPSYILLYLLLSHGGGPNPNRPNHFSMIWPVISLSHSLSLSCDCGDLIARKFCMYYVQCIFQ